MKIPKEKPRTKNSNKKANKPNTTLTEFHVHFAQFPTLLNMKTDNTKTKITTAEVKNHKTKNPEMKNPDKKPETTKRKITTNQKRKTSYHHSSTPKHILNLPTSYNFQNKNSQEHATSKI